jgi:hypothetical protein
MGKQTDAVFFSFLTEKLHALGVPFVSEGSLRAEGHAKTPDVKLELPIAVRGRVVNWIDSKASFCDPIVHYEKGEYIFIFILFMYFIHVRAIRLTSCLFNRH